MNFSFLFAHKKTDRWGTPLSIVNELKRRNHTCNIYSIYDESETKYSENGIVNMMNDAWNGRFVPDVIVHMDFGLYQSEILTKKYFPKAKWIFESGDDPQSFRGYNFPKACYGQFDAIISPDIRCVNAYNERNMKAFWWTHFADTTLYTRDNIAVEYDAVSTRDPTEPFYKEIKNALGDRFITRRGFHAEEHANFLQTGKIVLQNSRYKEITRRIFEGMMAQRMVITDRLPKETEIDRLFEENKDIVYFDNAKDAIDKIKYYANDYNTSAKIAESGYRKVIENHTQIHRTDALLKIISDIT